MTTKALLLAGGLGTRLRPLTETVPKCLIPVAGKPMLDYWYDALEAAGISDVLLNTHHLRDQVVNHINAANAARSLSITEAWEPQLLGSAGTLAANRGFGDGADEIVIIYADNLSDVDLSALVAFHRAHGDPMTMMLFHTEYPEQCGIATLDEQDRITDFTLGEDRIDLSDFLITVAEGVTRAATYDDLHFRTKKPGRVEIKLADETIKIGDGDGVRDFGVTDFVEDIFIFA